MKSAILVIDMLSDFFLDKPMLNEKESLVKNINSLTKTARSKQIPIFFIRQEFLPDLSDAYYFMKKRKEYTTIKGTDGCAFVNGLVTEKTDHIITKKRFSAFFKTNLLSKLNKLGIDTLIITGIFSHACVRQTTIDAYQLDFNPILAKECISSWDKKHQKVTLDYLNLGLMIPLLSNSAIKRRI
ncbi:cysteine hydrolase [Candidatus Woesearchaeota archaeon]|jgi:nicotinamidase-related amidase|nr:cysteine hydrolase [Candidatus Woesearchaeota archaeon]